MGSRLKITGLTAILTLLTLILGTSAAFGLWLQAEHRSRDDTAALLIVVVIVGAPLVATTITAIGRAPWLKAIKVATVAGYVAMVASFSMLYMLYSMPNWFTTIERAPGAPTTYRQFTDTAETLEVAAWFGILSTAVILAALLLGAAGVALVARKGAS